MGKIADSLEKYFKETPPEQLDKDWEEIKDLNNIGPDATEYINNHKNYVGKNRLFNRGQEKS